MSRVIDAYELSPMAAGMLFHALREGASGVHIEQMICDDAVARMVGHLKILLEGKPDRDGGRDE